LIKNPNPQGKGLVPVLESLASSRALVPAVAKQINQISSELFTSMFILHSKFQFKPVAGKSYWLYQRANQFHLSLISPQEWGSDDFGLFVGECVLQPDITWSLSLDPVAANNKVLMDYIKNKQAEFEQLMQSAESVDENLPFYIEGLPFYQRVFASALANSLKQSMVLSGIQGLSYEQAQKCLSVNN
jgi:hypothetical protein